MQLGRGVAPGKVILFGEHAVVYGRPALAAPVTQVMAEAVVEDAPPGSGVLLDALDIDERIGLDVAPAGHPLAAVVRHALARLGVTPLPDWRVTIRSTVPIASGLGSGAAVSAAIVRALGAAAGRAFEPSEVSELVYEVERLHHGTPSGVDNTVIAYGQPVYFVRGQPPQPFAIARPFMLAIADSGIASPTKIAVSDVRVAWLEEPVRFEALFDAVATVVGQARSALAEGRVEALGALMDQNHALLQDIGVSCEPLDHLVDAARAAGAGGAKLSGAGRGGNAIALVTPDTAVAVAGALRAAGAVRVIVTGVGQDPVLG